MSEFVIREVDAIQCGIRITTENTKTGERRQTDYDPDFSHWTWDEKDLHNFDEFDEDCERRIDAETFFEQGDKIEA